MAGSPNAPWTVRRLTDWTVGFLRKHGVESPQKEARILLGHVLGVPPIEVIVRSEDVPTDDERAAFKALIQRRIGGEPVAYLTGTKDFYLLPFRVTPAVLTPRPDTETLVVAALDFLTKRPTARVLDLGTGSGCIAISIAHRAAGVTVDAVDVSAAAVAVARENAARHGVANRVQFHEGDWLSAVPAGAVFDLIVSNPPYIPSADIATLEAGVRDHEPHLALDGGPDGLAFYRRLATDAGPLLHPTGQMLVEVGHTQSAAVRELFTQTGWAAGPTYKDLSGIERVVTIQPGTD